jgi:farnesyl diphosphate synthase
MIARSRTDPFSDRIDFYRDCVEKRLTLALDDPGIPAKLNEAIKYAVLGPGKRVRPLLVYATGELFELDRPPLDAIAAAVELIHAYSLVHDDLPAMDNDDLRRGRPTTHRAFGEALAILAGDGLQALAFEILCCDESLTRHPESQSRIVAWLARAAGPAGMVGGQTLDVITEGQALDEKALEGIHSRKTGALIKAAVMMTAELRVPATETHESLERLADDLGVLFQIRDDLLEIEQDTATLGKNSDSDLINLKSTYPSVLGPEAARHRAETLYARAQETLQALGAGSAALHWVTAFIFHRSH